MWKLTVLSLQRFFLAEILKTSPVPPGDILQFIIARDIKPQWEAMALPLGKRYMRGLGLRVCAEKPFLLVVRRHTTLDISRLTVPL